MIRIEKTYPKIIFSIAWIIIAMAEFCLGQSPKSKGDKLFNQFAYSSAIPKYEKSAKKNSHSYDLWSNLAESYRINNNYTEAERCYAHLVTLPACTPSQKFNYAMVLMNNQKYDEAYKWLQAYNELSGSGDKRAENFISAIDFMPLFYNDSNFYTMQKLAISSENSDFGAALYNDGIIFASSRKSSSLFERRYSWTEKPFLSLYYSKGLENNFIEPSAFASDIQSKYNNGPVCFSADGHEMYITSNNTDVKAKNISDKTIRLKIYKAVLQNGKWKIEEPFQYNNDNYSCAHAALSPDGKRLYFSSDMPGSIGGMDLYVCTKQGSNWSKPVNLGTGVNTKGNEMFATIDNDGKIYFASNGLPGLGGLDIYSTRLIDGKYSEPRNIGAPINSSYDDFEYVFDSKNNLGYLSSNRDNKTDDDIYTFRINGLRMEGLVYDAATGYPIDIANVKININDSVTKDITTGLLGDFEMIVDYNTRYHFFANKEAYMSDSAMLKTDDAIPGSLLKVEIALGIPPSLTIEGTIYEENTKIPIGGIEVQLLNLKTNKIELYITADDGKYIFKDLDPKTEYRVTAENPDCINSSIDTSTSNWKESPSIQADIELSCVGNVVRLKKIHYETDKYNIRPEDKQELNSLIEILNKYPDMKIELRSHTDSRSDDNYNLELSDKRAKSAVRYLVKNGINVNRLVAKGYGESMPLNKCTNGVKCTEEEYLENRRTEFKILNMK